MALRDWLPRRWRPAPGPGQTPVHVDDPSFDSWEVVRDFADVRTARAWHQALIEAGIEAVADRRLAARPLRPRRHRPAGPGRPLERSRVASLQPRLTEPLDAEVAPRRRRRRCYGWAEARARTRAVSPFDPTQTAREPIVSLVPWGREQAPTFT